MFHYVLLIFFVNYVIDVMIHLQPFGHVLIMLEKVKCHLISMFIIIDFLLNKITKYFSCKQEQRAFEKCANDKMNLERPEPGYFSMVRMHDSKRPVPSDPFRIGSLERPPSKLEVPNPPSLFQVNEYPEAKIGMKFGHRKPWMFESKLWD